LEKKKKKKTFLGGGSGGGFLGLGFMLTLDAWGV